MLPSTHVELSSTTLDREQQTLPLSLTSHLNHADKHALSNARFLAAIPSPKEKISLSKVTSTTPSPSSLDLRLIPNSLQKRLTLTIPPIRLGIRQPPKLSLLHLLHTPSTRLLSLLEKLLVLLKSSATSFWRVEVRPHAGEQVCAGEDEVDPEFEVVEHERGYESDGEVGEAPDDYRDGSALGSCGCGVNFRRDEPGCGDVSE